MRSVLAAIALLLPVSACCMLCKPADPKWSECGVVVGPKAGPGGATASYPYFGSAHQPGERLTLVAPLLRCQVQFVSLAPDNHGDPAVSVVLVDQDKATFEKFAGAHINEQMAIVVDRKVVSQATVNERLPGQVLLFGKYSKAEVDALKRSLE